MAIAIVGSPFTAVNIANLSMTGVTSGNTILVCALYKSTDGTSTFSLTDDTDGAMTTLHSVRNHGSGANNGFAFYVIDGVSAGTHTFTDNSTTVTASDCVGYELSGITTSALEGSQDFTDADSSVNTGSITTAGEAFLSVISSPDGSTGTLTPGTGWTQDLNVSRELGFSRIVSSGGSYNGDYTMGNTRNTGGSYIALYDSAGAPAGSSDVNFHGTNRGVLRGHMRGVG